MFSFVIDEKKSKRSWNFWSRQRLGKLFWSPKTKSASYRLLPVEDPPTQFSTLDEKLLKPTRFFGRGTLVAYFRSQYPAKSQTLAKMVRWCPTSRGSVDATLQSSEFYTGWVLNNDGINAINTWGFLIYYWFRVVSLSGVQTSNRCLCMMVHYT